MRFLLMKTILVIEDEQDMAELVAFHLEKEGYLPLIANDGASGLEQSQTAAPDLILLDLMLPGISGIDICKVLKGNEKTAAIPIIMLTAKGEEIDRVVGFEVGADDYMGKPFNMRELLLRIRAVLRRTNGGDVTRNIITIGLLSIDSERHIVNIAENEISLTSTEFKLLMSLAERLGRVQSRERLMKDVWGISHIGDTRTVDTHITRLRNKLGKVGNQIRTVRGYGYKMETA
jgi:two-component system, OmpR family, phosphate regulon response regulator PhoB